MNARSRARLRQATLAVVASALLVAVASRLFGQNASPTLTLLSKELRRSVPITMVGTQEFVALDDLATAFQLTVREDPGAITVTFRGRNIVLTSDQTIASVAGRLVSLPAAPTRASARWFVPVEFINRALALVYDQRLELRRPSHLLLIGDVRVPRVSVRYEPLANAARLTIDAAPRAASTVTLDAQRLLVKFDADAVDPVIPALQPQALVAGVRLADAATVEVDLGPRFAAFRSSTEVIDNTTRVVIDLAGAEPTTAAPGRGAPPPAPPPPPDIPAVGATATTIRTIAIDAGHGGDDPGAKGPGGTSEKDLTLAAARRVKTAIETRLGLRVLLTRDEDRNVPLDDRVAIANNSKADLLLSLHASASFRGTPSGASIYVAAMNDAAQRTPHTAERLPALSGGLRDIELVEWDSAQLRYEKPSATLADILRAQFQGRVPLDEQQLLSSGPFRVLESANMPAVLIELGYLTNAEQEQQLSGAEFQNAFSQAVVDAIVKFREFVEQNPGELR